MPETEKKTKKGSTVGVLAERAATSQLQDRSSDKLRKTASAVGNEELKNRVEKGKAGRDELLEFMVERLRAIREAQSKELELSSIHRQRDWWKQVSDKHKEEYTKPKPTQWKEVAKIYEEAAYQLCRGALGRGRMLVERAIEKEKKTFGDLTKLVDTSEIDTDVEEPAVMEGIAADEPCPTMNVPQEIKQLTHEIENVTMIAKEPPGRKRKRDPWWTLEEEEEEEDGEGDGA